MAFEYTWLVPVCVVHTVYYTLYSTHTVRMPFYMVAKGQLKHLKLNFRILQPDLMIDN